MKKILSLILTALLISASASGCYTAIPNTQTETENIPPKEDASLISDVDDTNEKSMESSEDVISPESTPLISEEPSAASRNPADEINVRPTEWQSVEWEDYSNQYFTLKLPKGWQVEWQGDANQLEWMAYKPDKAVGLYNLDHCYAAKDANMMQTIGMKMSLSEGTVQEFFETLYANTTEYFTVHNSCVPANKDALQAMRPNTPIRDYQSLYATFKDENLEGEGIYTAVIMDSPDVVVRGANYGAWEINCTFSQWAPQGGLVNWAPVLAAVAQSFAYTDYYIQQWMAIAGAATEPQPSVNDTDPVMEAFEERSKSDTIIQEKRSDMIGEYERVYDNNDGQIYRAYNGFLDDIGEQSRYTPITDSQYADGYVGWIDK